jgi:hypothetical protein
MLNLQSVRKPCNLNVEKCAGNQPDAEVSVVDAQGIACSNDIRLLIEDFSRRSDYFEKVLIWFLMNSSALWNN